MVCSTVEGRKEGMGRMKERRLERMAPLSDSWTDGIDGVVLAVGELRADWMASRSTGEALMIYSFRTRNWRWSHERRMISASGSSKSVFSEISSRLDGGENTSLTKWVDIARRPEKIMRALINGGVV